MRSLSVLYTTTSITMLLLQENVMFRYFVQDSSIIMSVPEEPFINYGMVTVSSNCICLCVCLSMCNNSVCVSLSLCLSACVCICLYVYLSTCICLCMFVCLYQCL